MEEHRFYAELVTGERKPITEEVYKVLTVVHGWFQVLMREELTVIKGP